ncbi:MAG TPA: hypothetical protein VFN39_12465 [Gemmatimonadaceae bacterium]|nr:hypothetical protein [Gemmatimonadaceae bacterium]
MRLQHAPTLYRADTFPPRADLQVTYRAHPKGGFTPIDASSKGILTVRCPYSDCRAVLIREVNASALADGYFRCPACHRKSLGTGARASMQRRAAGPTEATEGRKPLS